MRVARGIVINRGSNPQRAAFKVAGDIYDGLHLTVEADFWADEIGADGTSSLDRNIDAAIQEVRAALYYISATATRH